MSNNRYVFDFVKILDRRYAIDTKDMSLADWICANTTLRGKPFSFSRFPFQEQIAADEHPDMCVIKISQIGMTEVEIRKSLAMLRRNDGLRLIFSLPNEDMYKRVSKARIQPIVKDNAIFNTEQDVGAARSMEMMQFGRSFLYVVDSSEASATSIDADVLINDEVDLMDQTMLGLFQSRLQGSDYRIHQRISTPTFEGFGIDLDFRNSDQHYYLVRCDACRHYNDPVFSPQFVKIPGLPSNIEDLSEIDTNVCEHLDLHNAYVRCERCSAPLDLGRTDNREWVAKHPGRSRRGYRVRTFSTDRLDIPYIIDQLLKYRERNYIKGFKNTVLGEPMTTSNAQISQEQITSSIKPGTLDLPTDTKPHIMVGIDVGAIIYMVWGMPKLNGDIIIYGMDSFPSHKLNDKLEDLMSRFTIVSGAIDRLPYTPTADAVSELTNRAIIPVQYTGNREINFVYSDVDTEVVSHVQADRTKLLDCVATAYQKGKVQIYNIGNQRDVYIEHLRNMVRDETPEKPAMWRKLSSADHYFHATGYMVFAEKIRAVYRKKLKTETRSAVVTVPVNVKYDPNNSLPGHTI